MFGRLPLSCLVLVSCLGVLAVGEVPVISISLAGEHPSKETIEEFTLPAIELPSSLHFEAPDGREIQISAGTYGLFSDQPSTLTLLPESDSAPTTIRAEEIILAEELSAPVARILIENDQTTHLLLLLPTGQGLEAIGSVSQVTSRGNFSFNRKASASAISQTLTTPNTSVASSSIQREAVIGKSPGETLIPDGLPTGLPGQAPFGVRVLGVVYDPKAPNRQGLRELVNRPEILRQTITAAWESSRSNTCDDLRARLGQGDLIYSGVTLYDLVCNMGEITDFAMQSQGPSSVVLHLNIPGNYLEFTSTTPSALGSYADPRFSVRYDLRVMLTLSISGGDRLIRVQKAAASIQNAKLDSHGLVGDLILTLGNFFTNGKLTPLAESALNSARVDLTRQVSTKIEPANALLNTPPGMTYAGRWVRRNTLIIVYAPLPGPLPLQNGWVAGTIRWKKEYGATNPPSCSGLSFRSTVQTGPAPLEDPDTGSVGPPPTKIIDGSTTAGPFLEQGGEYTCAYKVAGLFAGIPNTVQGQARGLTTALQSNNQFLVTGIKMAPKGWNGRINPTPGTAGKDFSLDLFMTSPGVAVITGKQFVTPKNPGDPAPFRRVIQGSVKRQSGIFQQTPTLRR